MKSRPLINAPSLGSVHALGYWITICVMMLGGSMVVFLNYIFFITMVVPVVGAFRREPKLQWRIFSALTVAGALGFLAAQYLRNGMSGLVFYHASDPFGFLVPQVNFTSFITVALIFLPLSFACALHRIRMARRRDRQTTS